MPLDIATRNIDFNYPFYNTLENLVNKIIYDHRFLRGEITVIFTDDSYLLSLNREFLNHDYYTDILCFDYSDNETISGDLFISVERVRENSNIFNVDFPDELDRVIIHGILHLVGYNDSSEEEKDKMRSKETEYLTYR